MMLATPTSDNDAAIAVFGSMFLFGGPVFAFIVFRWMKHRERMAMLQRGIMPPGLGGYQAAPPPAYGAGQSGTVFIPDPSSNVTLRKGITTAFIGLALLIGLSFIGYHGDGVWTPGAWLLGGLIPLFVGIAQIVIAVLSGAQINVSAWQRQAPPQEPPLHSVPNPPPASPAGSYSGPFTYRPPNDVPEIPRSNPPKSL